VQEIQRALVQAGYLNEEPSGRWDDRTRAAMLRYQADHGFPTTGLPEAKSLMKLGLGPHPLPEDVDPSARTQARANSAAKPGSEPPAQPDPAASAPPPHNP
jgi:peptidoglycan hydrolase-like protein with peptidoglycan-binding domain